MSSDFDRMFRRACGGYRLHPKMVPHMWQAGQSGNPSGTNGAVRVARERSERAVDRRNDPAHGALRARRYRERRRRGVAVVNFQVGPDAIDKLVALGWLDATVRGNNEWVTDAVTRIGGACALVAGNPYAARDVSSMGRARRTTRWEPVHLAPRHVPFELGVKPKSRVP